MASLAAPTIPVTLLSHESDLKEKYHRWMGGWAALTPEGRNVLSSLQEVDISYFAAPGFKDFQPGKIAILPTVPFMIYWYFEDDRRIKYQFNFVEAYEKGRSDGSNSGIFLKSKTKQFILPLNRSDIDYKKVIILKFDQEELWLRFPREALSTMWQTAFAALLKSFFQSLTAPTLHREAGEPTNLEAILPRHCSLLRETLGLLFDITASQKSDQRNSHAVWTSLKVTYLRVDSETQEQYYAFDRSQAELESSCEEILTCVGEKLDPVNVGILSLYLNELSIIEYEKRKKVEGHEEQGWVCRGLGKPEMMALWVSDFTYVMQQYRKCDSTSVKQALRRKFNEIPKKSESPVGSFFEMASMYCLSTKLQLTVLSKIQTKSANSEATNASISILAAKVQPKPKSKWYKESCDCILF